MSNIDDVRRRAKLQRSGKHNPGDEDENGDEKKADETKDDKKK